MNGNEKRFELAMKASRLFAYFGLEAKDGWIDRLFPVLSVGPSAVTAANPYHDEHGRFTTGPEEESSGGSTQGDLETKKSIGIGDTISFIPQGGQRSVVIKVVGKDRGKGSGVSGQRVVNGVVKPGVNHYEVPVGVKTVKSVSGNVANRATKPATAAEILGVKRPAASVGPSSAAKIANAEKMYGTGSKQHLEAQSRFGNTAQKAVANAQIERERERIKNAASETTGRGGSITERLAGMKEKVEREAAERAAALKAESAKQQARNEPVTHQGQPSWSEELTRMRTGVAAEVAKRNAEILSAVNNPSTVAKSISWNGTMRLSESVQQGVLNGADALEQAGLKGDHGSISVRMDSGGQTRNGAYQPGMNQISMNDRLDKGNAAFTFAHEYGHHLDYFESRRTGEKRISQDLEFRRLVRATPEWKTLQKDTQGVYTGSGRSRGRAAYLSSWPELFARATAQWTAVRSGDRDMLTVLDRRSVDHWSGASFAAIGKYLDKTLAKSSKSVRASALNVVEFYNEDHDEQGRFTGPGTAGKVVDAVREHGGATLEPGSGKDVVEGYAVGLGTVKPGTEHNSDVSSFSAKDVRNWLRSKAVKETFASNPKAKIGVWEDGGKIYLEPSEQVDDRATAIKLGKERNQIGVQHLVPKGEGYISTGGSGK